MRLYLLFYYWFGIKRDSFSIFLSTFSSTSLLQYFLVNIQTSQLIWTIYSYIFHAFLATFILCHWTAKQITTKIKHNQQNLIPIYAINKTFINIYGHHLLKIIKIVYWNLLKSPIEIVHRNVLTFFIDIFSEKMWIYYKIIFYLLSLTRRKMYFWCPSYLMEYDLADKFPFGGTKHRLQFNSKSRGDVVAARSHSIQFESIQKCIALILFMH